MNMQQWLDIKNSYQTPGRRNLFAAKLRFLVWKHILRKGGAFYWVYVSIRCMCRCCIVLYREIGKPLFWESWEIVKILGNNTAVLGRLVYRWVRGIVWD